MTSRIFGIIGWIGTGLIFVALAIRFGFPAREQYGTYMTWAGLACIVVYALGQWEHFVKAFSDRQTRYGTLTTVSVAVVLGILVAVNYIGAKQNKRWDVTANRSYSLSEQSKQVLSKLDAPLEVIVFDREARFPQFQDRLREYEYASKHVTTQYVDPDKKPAVAKQYGVGQFGTVLMTYKSRTERTTSENEQDLTNTIIKVTSRQVKTVYFSQGHNEHDPTSGDREAYADIATSLKRESYNVERLALTQQGVPEDASVVVIAGPKTDFYGGEIDAIRKYLDKGGKVFLLIDPPDKPDSPPLNNLIALAHDWGMDVGKDVVLDASGTGRLLGTDASVPVVSSYLPHPITRGFGLLTAFPLARSITPVAGGVNGHVAQPLVQTGERSWAETDIKSVLTTGQAKLEEGKGDKPGPISLAAAVSAPVTAAPAKGKAEKEDADAPKPESRLVVFGDSDFAGNGALGIQGNRDLFMNAVGWLAQQENLIAIRPAQAAERRIVMTAGEQTKVVIFSLLLVPGVIFGAGIRSWWRRRR